MSNSNEVRAEAVEAFIHGPYNMNRGDVALMPKGIYDDLEKVGLVKTASAKSAPAASNKMAPDAENKGRQMAPGVHQPTDAELMKTGEQTSTGSAITSSSVAPAPGSTPLTGPGATTGATAPAPAPVASTATSASKTPAAPAKTTAKTSGGKR